MHSPVSKSWRWKRNSWGLSAAGDSNHWSVTKISHIERKHYPEHWKHYTGKRVKMAWLHYYRFRTHLSLVIEQDMSKKTQTGLESKAYTKFWSKDRTDVLTQHYSSGNAVISGQLSTSVVDSCELSVPCTVTQLCTHFEVFSCIFWDPIKSAVYPFSFGKAVHRYKCQYTEIKVHNHSG